MRTIKFRAWDNKERKMLYKHIGVLDNKVIHFEGGIGGEFLFDDELLPMQSTGLVDRNGVEIYEDDIVQWSIKDKGNDWETKLVEWDEDDACFYFGGFLPFEIEAICSVVGNRYENSELLATRN